MNAESQATEMLSGTRLLRNQLLTIPVVSFIAVLGLALGDVIHMKMDPWNLIFFYRK